MYTRASPADILARKSARRTKVRRLSASWMGRARRGSWPAARAAAARRLPRAPDTPTSARESSRGRKSARKSVSVSVSVPWNLSLSKRSTPVRREVDTGQGSPAGLDELMEDDSVQDHGTQVGRVTSSTQTPCCADTWTPGHALWTMLDRRHPTSEAYLATADSARDV